jgi:hypothetical protein
MKPSIMNKKRSKNLLVIVAVLLGHSFAQTSAQSVPTAPPQSAAAPATAFHVTAKPPRPLEHAIDAVRLKYGWVVSYEDPQYISAKDVTESAAPKGMEEAKVTLVPAGETFNFDLLAPKSPDEAPPAEESLKRMVEAYNHSGNPGQFELRNGTDGAFSVVGVAARDEKGTVSPQKILLDATLTIPADKRTIDETLDILCHKLTEATHIPVSTGITPRNLLEYKSVSAGGQNLSARTLLAQALAAGGHPMYWRLLFDPNSKSYLLNIHGLAAKKAPAHINDAPSKPPQAGVHP